MTELIDTTTLQLQRIKNQTPTRRWGPKCFQCNRTFAIGAHKYRWRLKFAQGSWKGLSFWRTDCNRCLISMLKVTSIGSKKGIDYLKENHL